MTAEVLVDEDRSDNVPIPVRVEIELEVDATLGYASIQNAVPVVRSITIANRGTEAIEQAELLVSCSPSFARGTKLRFERLQPGEVRRITPVDLFPDHNYLAELQETVRAGISATLTCEGIEIGAAHRPIEVLAYDQWAGLRGLPELLAAFSMPNNPAVDVVLGKASVLLRSSFPDLGMDGYQSKSRDVVWKQISAIYSTLAAAELQYAEPPASFGVDGQKIRTPDRILEGRVATCLDLAMLFSSCMEQAGLRPVILLKEGHAWLGVWLHQVSFGDPITDDVQAVRKRVASGELLVFETTGVAKHHSRRPSLRVAAEHGATLLEEEESFRYAIDIRRARELQIKPLPSRGMGSVRAAADITEAPAGIETTPELPPLDAANLVALDIPVDDTPEGRLTMWKSKLLDLTLRNRLLNFKPTKSTLHLVCPNLGRLEDAVADGVEFRVRPVPALMEGNDPRSAQVHRSRGGQTPLEDMALEALDNKELIARIATQEGLNGNLLAIFTAAKTGLEEGGANTLYLALGFLRWTEAEKAESSHLAPILLVPVSLQRQSVRSGFRLVRHDDETIVNPTLLQFLRSSFEMRLKALDVVPRDEHGVDVGKVFQAFRLAVAEIPKWEVLEDVHLGLFSFTKYLMWKDLQDRTAQLKTNRVVNHLIEHPGQALARDFESSQFDRLDDSHRPQDILAPLLSDSSQLKAICAVDAGRDLVLEGPPGTGKSQTITNLIAHCLGKGKTVLFVSEKMAALDVVHRRLTAIGLGPFCLELHSSKARKMDVVNQLGRSLNFGGARASADWTREAERLASLRHDLNGVVDSLHRPYPIGLTVFEALGIGIAHAGQTPSPMPWADPLTHSAEELEKLRETVKRMGSLASAVGSLQAHPLSHIGQTRWSNAWQDDLIALAGNLDAKTEGLERAAHSVAPALKIETRNRSLVDYAAMDGLADVLLSAPKVPAPFARQAFDARARSAIHTMVEHGLARNAAWDRLQPRWSADIANFASFELKAQWGQAANAVWPASWLKKRGVKGRLRAFWIGAKSPRDADVAQLFEPLAALNEEDELLRSMRPQGEALLDATFQGVQTDWAAVGDHELWAKSFAEATQRLANGSEENLHLQDTLSQLVSMQRGLLLPNGPAGQAFAEFRDAWREFKTTLELANAAARVVVPLGGQDRSDGALGRIRGVLSGWQHSRRLLQPWCLWRQIREQAVAQGLQGLVSSLDTGAVALNDVQTHFELSYQTWWVKKTVDNDPVLREFSSADHGRKIVEFKVADAKFQKLTEQYIVAKLAGNVPAATAPAAPPDSELGMLRREMQRQRGHMPVRQLVHGLPTLLSKLKPCLLMSPLSVAQFLDAGHAQFDLVVFDEASQIPVWDAVGAIARGKQLVVVGDPKQLPPTNFFGRSTDNEEGGEGVDDLESILDECLGVGMNQLSLKWHYRSKHESLIAFSNMRYYDSSLITFPSPVTDDVAVRFERQRGVYDRGGSRTNRIEAEAIVAAIEKHYLSASRNHLSLGVVTFNQPQQSLIDTLLDERRRTNPDLDRAIAAGAQEPLFVKNLENVQGDERDVIFFSITYGADAAGKVMMNFGPLNGEGGQRRLNVAISRARESVVVFSTLMPEQIDLARVRAAGVTDLKHYLEFALKGPRALAEQAVWTGLEPDSPFEVAVIKQLRDRGWVVHPQVGCSGYRLDLGVVDPRAPGRYLLGIECDGRAYHLGANARDRDRLRQHVLEDLGWRIHRIWSTDWWTNLDGEMEKLSVLLQSILDEPKQPGSTEPVVEEGPVEPVSPTHGDSSVSDDVPTAAATPATRVFTVAVLPQRPAGTFYDSRSNAMVVEDIRTVIETEGPVSEVVLCRRVARAWGLERTGVRIVERVVGLVPSSLQRTVDGTAKFYWPSTADPTGPVEIRVGGMDEATKRHVDDICSEEIAQLITHVLANVGACPVPDLARSVCKLVGMARTPADAEARVASVASRMISSGQISDLNGRLRLGN